jgi:hypothetical protein
VHGSPSILVVQAVLLVARSHFWHPFEGLIAWSAYHRPPMKHSASSQAPDLHTPPVHTLPSVAFAPAHDPALQASPVVHAFPSSQEDPLRHCHAPPVSVQ